MAGINRFFNPSQAKYQSQFVPKNLPVDLMAKSLYAKQGKADQMMAASLELGDWKQAALGDHDTKYVQAIQNEVKDFAAQSMNEDRTSPEFQRKYLSLTNRIKNDENLAKVRNAVEKDAIHEENVAKLKASGQHDYAKWLDADYQYKRNEYTKEGGKGFTGMGLGDENILKGTDKFGEMSNYFKDIKDSGGESIKTLPSGISYKNGWTGVGDSTIKAQVERQYNLMAESRVGQQLRAETLGKMGYVETTYQELPEEEKKAVDKQVDAYMRNEFLDVGKTFIHGKSTTNRDQADNAQRTEDIANDPGVLAPTVERPYGKISKETAIEQGDKLLAQSKLAFKELWEDNKRVENGLPSAFTPADRAQRLAEAHSYKKQSAMLGEAVNDAWNNVFNAQVEKYKPGIEKVFVEQEKVWNKLKGLIPDKDFQEITKYIASRDNYLNQNTEGNHKWLNALKKNLPAGGEISATINNLIELETKKNKFRGNIENVTRDKWGKEEQSKLINTYQMQPSGTQVRTDDKSTMHAFNNLVKSNNEEIMFLDSKGNVMPIASYGADARLLDFNGDSVVPSGNRGKHNFVANGVAKIQVRKVDAEGNKLNNPDGSPTLETVTVQVNAVPMGNNSQFFENNWAREQAENAALKARQGKTEESKLLHTNALQLNENSIKGELVNFSASNLTDLPIKVNAYSPAGEFVGQTNVTVKKVGTQGNISGYTIKAGNSTQTVQTMDQVNARIQEITNSQIPK